MMKLSRLGYISIMKFVFIGMLFLRQCEKLIYHVIDIYWNVLYCLTNYSINLCLTSSIMELI